MIIRPEQDTPGLRRTNFKDKCHENQKKISTRNALNEPDGSVFPWM